jgi:hypothetical protein
LSGVSPDGRLWIRFAVDGEPVAAALAWHPLAHVLVEALERRAQVLVTFLDGDERLPVVLGPLVDRIDLASLEREATPARIEIRAREAVHLVCGSSRIELDADGTVKVKGAEVRTASTGTTRIEGADVKIN